MKQKLSMLLFAAIVGQSVMAQTQTVKGTVVDKEGFPLPGVTIKVEGTSKGAVTDLNGEYTIDNISPSATLEFTYVGMKTRQLKASSTMAFNGNCLPPRTWWSAVMTTLAPVS